MTYRRFTRILPTAVLMLAGSAALAATASEVIAARQAHYKELGKAFKTINDQLKSSTPDLAAIEASAQVVERLGQQQKRQNWFPAGTQAGQGLQTAAKPAIWSDPADFNAKRADFAKASVGYAAIVAKGDVTAIRAATGGVGKSCKGCHEGYRDQDKS